MSGARPVVELPPIDAPADLMARTPLPEVVDADWSAWDEAVAALDTGGPA
jgi:hypothetical protein